MSGQLDWAVVSQAFDQGTTVGQPQPQAAVAVILSPHSSGLAVLLIERADKENDPWSGQMAFPGGRTEADDDDSRHTALRETSEEVGLDLSDAAPLGALDSIDGGRATGRPLLVAAQVFGLDHTRDPLTLNHEVASTVWMPLHYLNDPERKVDFQYQPGGVSFPGIELDGDLPVLWGLTLRFLVDLNMRLEPILPRILR